MPLIALNHCGNSWKLLKFSQEELGDDDFQPMNAVIDLETLQVAFRRSGFLAGWEWVVVGGGNGSEGMEYLYLFL